jgi:hypothetical protein
MEISTEERARYLAWLDEEVEVTPDEWRRMMEIQEHYLLYGDPGAAKPLGVLHVSDIIHRTPPRPDRRYHR